MPFYSNGRTTGLVCDSGDGYTSISSMFEGFFKTNAIQNNFIAGNAITDYLNNLLH